MLLRMRALDVDLELAIDAAAGEDVAELLLALLPASWEQAAKRENAPLLRLSFERRAGSARLVEELQESRGPGTEDEDPGSRRGVASLFAGSPPALRPRGEGVRGERVARVLATARADADPRLWLGRLEQEIVAAVARRSRCFWLHAGAVLWHGAALVLPGPSFAGKSTLVDALVGRGAHYLSDEWAAIDGGGRIHALPRPIRLREGKARAAAELTGAWPLQATALLRFHPRAAALPHRLAAADALAALLPHAIGPGEAGGLTAIAALLGRPVFAGFRGEAETFLDGWLGQLAELQNAA